jgi:hypothetical protein
MPQDKKVEQHEEPKLSMTAKVVFVVFIVLTVTLFFLMWKGLGGGPIITPRAPL